MTAARHPIQCIVPPYLLHNVAKKGNDTQQRAARATLLADTEHRSVRAQRTPGHGSLRAPSGHPFPERTVFDCRQGTSLAAAVEARAEGEGPTGTVEVDEAYDGLGATHALWWDAFHRNSIDGHGLPLRAYVHYGVHYDNAFWDGEQMVFGDGDGESFNRFTIAVDVIGHELTHGVTQHEANLKYSGQSGALNESISDAFGSMVKQRLLGQTADEADWLIGIGLLKHEGAALRSMKEPGTAYDDPVLGKDPQPGHMSDYVETDEDNGGVHINSGIPNRAFYLAASELGGSSWEKAGKVWYESIRDNSLHRTANFEEFASMTSEKAGRIFGKDSKEFAAIRGAWIEVGVLKEKHVEKT